jgi:hypothetical protein
VRGELRRNSDEWKKRITSAGMWVESIEMEGRDQIWSRIGGFEKSILGPILRRYGIGFAFERETTGWLELDAVDEEEADTGAMVMGEARKCGKRYLKPMV